MFSCEDAERMSMRSRDKWEDDPNLLMLKKEELNSGME